jgi:glycosyltransferase involved in cell wall biosynthesis
MTRVLHVIAEMGVGGAEAVVVELTGRGRTVGWESAVASAGGARVAVVERAGTRHVSMPLVGRNPLAFLQAVRRLRQTISTWRPDVVIAHNVLATLVTSAALKLSPGNTPLISIFHGVKDQHYRTAARIFRSCSDYVVAVSGPVRARLVDAGLDGEIIRVIRNAVSAPVLEPRETARLQLGLDPAVPVALCLARLVPQKRHDVLLRAWKLLPGQAVLLLAGDGEERESLQGLAKNLGLDGSVRFLGNRADVGLLLSAADASVLASDWEGLPMALLESMAAGVPVVSTSVDGVREVVRPSEGILVPRRDSARLAQALAEILFNPEKRTRFGKAAQVGVEERFNPETMAGQYARLCDEAIA